LILVDSNVLVAIISRTDDKHATATQWIEDSTDVLLIPPTVIAEVCYLIGERNGDRRAEAEFLRSFEDEDGLRLAELLPDDLRRTAELVEQYADMGLGATDASVIAIAERLGIERVATFDRRHFPAVVPSHVNGSTLLP
jgi:predicted nucleic acid-binding protein